MELALSVKQASPGAAVIAVDGEIDIYSAPKLRERLTSLIEAGVDQLILDMDGVEFLDSTGLGVLVGALKRAHARHGSIDLVCTQSRILRIFRITGFNKVFHIYDTVGDALAARLDGTDLPTVPGPSPDAFEIPNMGRRKAEETEADPKERTTGDSGRAHGTPGLSIGRDRWARRAFCRPEVSR